MKRILNVIFLFLVLNTFSQTKQIDFTPKIYSHNFTHKLLPVLTLSQGDTLASESVDAGGFDKRGVNLTKSGNPLTGPFYIEGASPGDIIAITLTNVSLNRDYAITVQTFVKRSLPMENIKEVYGRKARMMKWRLDTMNKVAKPMTVPEEMADYSIPLHPFLGCVGVAAPANSNEPLTYFADKYGGNMDFYKVTTGATVYLPVFHEGALLYLGDGHAAQGDGEINGDALETSMNFAFVAHVIKGAPALSYPRLEDADHIVTMGMGKSLEKALKIATLGMMQWLHQDYELTVEEVSQVMGPCIEYRIPTLAGPKYEVAAMLKKEFLKGLKKK